MIAAFVSDLIFASRIETVAAAAGREEHVLRSADAVLERAADWSLVLLDLTLESAAIALAGELKRRRPELRLVGFFPHVRADLKQQAQAAGVDQVLPRSVFVERLPALLASKSEPGRSGEKHSDGAGTVV